ncbi:hypothetical protein BJF88_16270 [Cellulosimicrobium sp. CUA-896]|nr:hypothetical protein BJF88_16270 [Cellulosimicrobium sp. CUA-896]
MPNWPPVIVRTMSKILSVAIAIVVRTTTSAGRTLGIVMYRNMPKPLSPSSRAASTMSSGIALIAAERMVIAKPVWIQIITTMRKNVFHGWPMRNCCGGIPSHTSSWLSRPICCTPGWSGRNS